MAGSIAHCLWNEFVAIHLNLNIEQDKVLSLTILGFRRCFWWWWWGWGCHGNPFPCMCGTSHSCCQCLPALSAMHIPLKHWAKKLIGAVYLTFLNTSSSSFRKAYSSEKFSTKKTHTQKPQTQTSHSCCQCHQTLSASTLLKHSAKKITIAGTSHFCGQYLTVISERNREKICKNDRRKYILFLLPISSARHVPLKHWAQNW